MLITRRSPFTGHLNEMEIAVTQDQLNRFDDPNRKELIQDIFPDLTPSEREFIKSGYTDSDWKALFGD